MRKTKEQKIIETQNSTDVENLILIGNGFDLYFGLKTSYSDFLQYIKMNYPDEKKDIEDFGLVGSYEKVEALWMDFENEIGIVNIDVIDEYCTNNETLKELFCLIEEEKNVLRFLFEKWVNDIQCLIDRTKFKQSSFFANSFIISFNYTKTIETNFSIKPRQIYHIHGMVGCDIVFGHKPESYIRKIQDEFYEGESECKREKFEGLSLLDEYLKMTEKPVQSIILKTNKIIKKYYDLQLRKIKNIYVVGLSYSDVDMPYFIWLNNHVNANWILGYYSEEDLNRAQELRMIIGCERCKIALTKQVLNDILV